MGSVRLAEGGWAKELRKAIEADSAEVGIVSPFIEDGAVARLFEGVQAPAIRLAPAGLSWLNEQLELAFRRHGKLQPAQLASLDWPDVDLFA